MKVTPFGKYVRKLRIERDQILKDMADSLEMSTALLSAIELGKRTIKTEIIEKLKAVYCLNTEELSELNQSVAKSIDKIEIDLKNNDENTKEAVLMFARFIEDKNHLDKEQLKRILGL